MNAKEYLEENGSYIIDTIAMRKFGMNVIRLMEEYAKLKLEEHKKRWEVPDNRFDGSQRTQEGE